MNLKTCVLPAIALLAVATTASATPTLTTKTKVGEAKTLKWELSYFQLEGTQKPAHIKINAKLEAYVAQYMKPEVFDEPDPPNQDMTVSMSVGVHTEELLSIEVSTYAYYGGAHGIAGVETLTYDLRTGEEVPSSAFFAGSALDEVAGRVVTALRQDYTYADGGFDLELPTAKNLGEILVRPTGLTFLWGQYGLGAPAAFGPIRVTLSWAELRDTIYSQGVLGSLAGGKSVTIDAPLGGTVFKPEPSEDDLAYLKRLEVEAINGLTGLSARQRGALAETEVWNQRAESGRALASLIDQAQLKPVADILRHAQNSARHAAESHVFAYILEEEAEALQRAINFSLANLEPGMATANDVQVLSTPQFAGDEGKALATLGAGERVGVMRRAGPGEDYHQVRAANGALGRVHREHLAIEALVTAEGQVQEDFSGDLVLGADGPRVRANRSVEVSRNMVGQLKGLVGGANANVVLKAVEITHRGQSWLVPYAFRSVPAGSPSVGAQPGVVTQLDQD